MTAVWPKRFLVVIFLPTVAAHAVDANAIESTPLNQEPMMNMALPAEVFITEVGPRDGLQMEKQVLPTADKANLIAGLTAAGLKAIQVAAFVHPQKVPTMADAEALIGQLSMTDGVDYSALTLNRRGVERACRTPIPWIEVSLSASEQQSLQNTGMTVDKAQAEIRAMVATARGAGRRVRGSIQCTFGCVDACEIDTPQVVELAALLLECGVDLLVLADTTGMATPITVRRILQSVLPLAAQVPVGLHLHDTRGLGLVNVMAGLEMGIVHFDTSLGGLGGCPFVSGAAGNIATEDTLHLMHSLNIATGVDAGLVAAQSRELSRFFGRALAGKMYRLLQP